MDAIFAGNESLLNFHVEVHVLQAVIVVVEDHQIVMVVVVAAAAEGTSTRVMGLQFKLDIVCWSTIYRHVVRGRT